MEDILRSAADGGPAIRRKAVTMKVIVTVVVVQIVIQVAPRLTMVWFCHSLKGKSWTVEFISG